MTLALLKIVEADADVVAAVVQLPSLLVSVTVAVMWSWSSQPTKIKRELLLAWVIVAVALSIISLLIVC